RVYTYSNLAFVLLGMAAANVQSTDDETYFATLLKLLKTCCRQFGVEAGENKSTTIHPFKPAGPVPVGYDGPIKHLVPVIGPPCDSVKGRSGGIISAGEDMLKFLHYQMTSPDIWYLQSKLPWSPLQDYCKFPYTAGPTVGLGWLISEITAGGL